MNEYHSSDAGVAAGPVPPPPAMGGQVAPGQPMHPGYAAAPDYATAPAYAAAPAPAPPAPAKGLAIAGLICAFLAPPIGLVLSIIALVKRRKAGASIGLPLTGLIISVLALIAITVGIVMAMNMLTQLAAICAELGPGVWQQGPVTYTCG